MKYICIVFLLVLFGNPAFCQENTTGDIYEVTASGCTLAVKYYSADNKEKSKLLSENGLSTKNYMAICQAIAKSVITSVSAYGRNESVKSGICLPSNIENIKLNEFLPFVSERILSYKSIGVEKSMNSTNIIITAVLDSLPKAFPCELNKNGG